MNNKYLLLLVFSLFFSLQACNNSQKNVTGNNQDSTTVDKAGLTFIKNVDEASQAEIKAATVAETTSKNPRVANFAHKLINDYNDAQQKLQAIKAKASITTATEISAADKKTIDSISKFSGLQFDQAFMKSVVDKSGKIDVLFVNASQDKSKAISGYARKIMPALQIQLDSARKISTSLK
jgi:putative membrane protein